MSSFRDSLSDEERAFIDRNVHKGGQREQTKGPKVDFHRWGKSGETSTHYFTILYVPESARETFGGVIPLPKRTLMHSNVRLFTKDSGKNSLFPKAHCGNVPHYHDDDLCYVCRRLEPIKDQLEDAERNGNTELVKRLKLVLGSSAKWRRGWVGEAFYRNEQNKKVWDRKIELFEISDFFWDKFFVEALFRKRAVKRDDWMAENDDQLQGMSENDRQEKYLTEAPPKFPLPWDLRKGFKITALKTGAKMDTKYEVDKSEAFPYSSFNVPSKLSGKKGYDQLVALSELGAANLAHLQGLFKAGLVPDLQSRFNDKITLEEQAIMLGLETEENGSSITSNDDTETVGNKLDGKRASVEVPSKKKAEPVSEKSEDEDDLDLSLDDSDDEPFPKSPPAKAPAKPAKAGKKAAKAPPVPEPEEDEEAEEEAVEDADDDDDLDLTLDDDDLDDLI